MENLQGKLIFLEPHRGQSDRGVQPHMFDYKGMVSTRSIAELLDIPMVGSPGEVMALTTNKWQSRAVVASHGVSVPKAQLLRPGDKVEMRVPLIIKPCREDNSMGITLVQTESDIESALIEGFKYDDQLLCEQFIPLGRELRIGVVDGEDDELEFLPVIEYFLGHKKQPIRTSADKISSPDGTANGMDFVGGEALASSSNSSSTPVWAPKNIAFPSFSTPNRGQRSCRSSKST
ncbi:unnamed protein product [Durusdinium trenchii]|uniref:ATP-grasp domain-containing protein n=1 Tax=Durusdinium trenchii TaxID=1381693 RepID=A0ABP0KVZ2_9DINO